MSARDQAVAVVLAVAIGIVGMLGVGLLPVEAAGRLKCEAPLRGSDPKEMATEGFLVGREEVACSDKGKSRLAIVGLVGVLFIGLGVASIVLPQSNFERMAFNGEDPEDVYETR